MVDLKAVISRAEEENKAGEESENNLRKVF